jgi:hypothetical protein
MKDEGLKKRKTVDAGPVPARINKITKKEVGN